jgi:polyphosphate glucokinase
MTILGVDVGGTGIKGAPVDIESGGLAAPRYRLKTPSSAKPQPMAEIVKEVVEHFDWHGPVGIGFPAVIRQGVARSAGNIHKSWIGTNAHDLFAEATGCPLRVLNDADAAGLAEMAFGAGRGRDGVVLIVTIGTGLGTALFTDGILVPNCELGHIEIRGKDAETRATDAARTHKNMSWKKWGKHFNEFLQTLDRLISPDLFILGGGTSKKYDNFREYINVDAEVVPAQLLNEAGIVGAALAAQSLAEKEQ